MNWRSCLAECTFTSKTGVTFKKLEAVFRLILGLCETDQKRKKKNNSKTFRVHQPEDLLVTVLFSSATHNSHKMTEIVLIQYHTIGVFP